MKGFVEIPQQGNSYKELINLQHIISLSPNGDDSCILELSNGKSRNIELSYETIEDLIADATV